MHIGQFWARWTVNTNHKTPSWIIEKPKIAHFQLLEVFRHACRENYSWFVEFGAWYKWTKAFVSNCWILNTFIPYDCVYIQVFTILPFCHFATIFKFYLDCVRCSILYIVAFSILEFHDWFIFTIHSIIIIIFLDFDALCYSN